MATISFTCPHCEKVLRSTQRPPAGRKVKCPACSEGFVPEFNDDDATGIQEEPRLKSKPKAVDDDDVDAEEVDVDEVEDDDEKPRKKKKSKRDDDDDDDSQSRKKKGKKKAGANKMLVYGGIALVCVGGLFSCALLGVAAFVWPGFMLSGNSALLAFVAADANMVMYADLKQTRTRMEPLEKMFREKGFGQNPGNNENKAIMDFMKNADKIVVSSNTNSSRESSTVVIQASAAEIEKFKKSPGMGAPQTLGGHANVYKPAGGGNLPKHVAFPSADLVVMSDQPEAEFIRALDRGKKGVQPNAAIDLGKSASGSLVWVAVVFDANIRRGMKQSLQQAGKASKKMEAAVPAVDGCKGVVISFDATTKQDLKIAATLTCKDAGDAAKMKDGLDDGFNQLRGFLALMQNAGAAIPGQPETPKGIIQDLNSTAFQVQGSNASATLTITSQSIQELARFAEKKGGMGMFP